MRISINLLPPEPEIEAIGKKKRTVTLLSGILLLIFLLINLGIFGFYWFLTKSTAKTLAAIKSEEVKITEFGSRERLYRTLAAKLSYLASLWQKKTQVEEVVDFAQTLLVPQLTLNKISLKEDGLTTLTLKVVNSDGLENFLNGVSQKEKIGKIEKIKVISTKRDKDGGYNISVSFKFLGTK